MLELFVITICMKTTPLACENAASAYYTQSGIERLVTAKSKHYSQRHPLTAQLVAYSAMIYQQQLVINLGSGKSCSLNVKNGTINYKWGF